MSAEVEDEIEDEVEVETDVREIFREAGVRGWLHAVPVDAPSRRLRDREVRVGADTPVVMASVYKIVLLVAFCRAADAGDLDPREPVTVEPDRRTVGPTGLSALADPVTLSWRDLATSMITVSDNAAADVILERLGSHRLRAVLDDLGLTATHIRGGTADVHRSLVADTGTDDVAAAFAALTDNDAPATVRALDPAYGSATTPSDMTRLLTALWRGETASAAQTSFARQLLRAQIWPHRLRAGFPTADVAGKTGTLAAIRNEIGVVTFDEEYPVAVAVFTHAARADTAVPRADAAIAQAARRAVTVLRCARL